LVEGIDLSNVSKLTPDLCDFAEAEPAMTEFYRPDEYDEHLCLKPSVPMILAMMYAARHLVLVFLAYFPGMAGTSDAGVIKGLLAPYFVVADIPALVLLLAWRFRAPEAGPLWRGIWHRGRIILALTLAVQVILLVEMRWNLMLAEAVRGSAGMLVVFYAFLSLIVLVYVSTSERVKTVFQDFPKRVSS
jgi:hypothetical protein